MRVGENPEKNKVLENDAYHRIIIPIYAPHLDGYFENALKVTQLCVGSVIKTSHSKSKLTIVNNGCCQEVTSYLQELFEKGEIDTLIHHKTNVGKIDAVIPIAKQASETLITIADGDVLFKNGWMQAVENVFYNFPEAGMVSPVPHGNMYSTYTSNTLFDATIKRILKFQSICNTEEMLRFARSIGREKTMYKKKIQLKYQLTVKRNDFSAVVGCGHFVSTLRNEIFKNAPKKLSSLAYSSEADTKYIDIPNEKGGFWRLATVENFAWHIGNFPEDWMYNEFKKISEETKNKFTKIPKATRISVPYKFKKFIVQRCLFNHFIKPHYLRYLGLKEDPHDY